MGACWPGVRQHHRRILTIARAIENQAFALMCNRCGNDPAPTNLAYDGHSMIVDPLGNILAEAQDQPCVLSAEIDPAAVLAWRSKFPALRDIAFQAGNLPRP
jgi:predicted amidohydrolase